MFTERTFILVFSNLLLVALLYYALKPATKGHFQSKKLVWIFPLIIVFCLFSFWGPDWFHYKETYEMLKFNELLNSNSEPIYRELIAWAPNYLIYRFSIWGVAAIITFIAFRVLKLDMGLATFYFVICSLIWFSYGRVSLAFALSTLGFSIIVSGTHKFISVPLGVFFIILSLTFHKSAIFMVLIIFLTLILAKSPKGVFNILLYLFPVFAILMPLFLGNFMSVIVSDESDFIQTVEYGQRYLSGEQTGMHFGSLGQIPSKILEWLPKYFVAFICFKIIKNDKSEVPKTMLYFCVLCFLIIYTSSFFILDLGYSTNVIFSRFQRFAILPVVVVMTYLVSTDKYSAITRKAQILFVCSTFYTLMYQAFCCI